MGESRTAKKITVARFSLAGDNFTTTDRIDFNDATDPNFKDSDKEGAYIESLVVIEPEGIGNNQAAEKPNGNVQALGIVETTYIFTGYITKTDGDNDDGSNIFLTRLKSWKSDQQVLKGLYEAGRFGVLDDNDITNNLTPIGTGATSIGLIFQNYKKEFNANKNRTNITLTFRLSRGPDI